MLLLGSTPVTEEYGLYEALANSLVDVEIQVNDESSHYHQPFVLKLRNTSSRSLNIILENGIKMIPEDESYQDFTTVKELLVNIPSKSTVNVPVQAMCMEAHDRAPAGDSKYVFSGKVDENMLGLTNLIEATELFSYMGQDAVWAVAEGKSARSICGYNYADGMPLIQYVAQLNGESVPEPPAENDYARNFQSQEIQYSIRGAFRFNSGWVANVQIGLFNEQNTVVRELYNNPETPKGNLVVEYEFDHSVYTDDFYTVRMMVDGEIFLENRFSFNPEDWPETRG